MTGKPLLAATSAIAVFGAVFLADRPEKHVPDNGIVIVPGGLPPSRPVPFRELAARPTPLPTSPAETPGWAGGPSATQSPGASATVEEGNDGAQAGIWDTAATFSDED